MRIPQIGNSKVLLKKIQNHRSWESKVEQHGLGLTVDPSDVAGIQQALLKVYHQSKTAAPLCVSTTGIEAYDRQALTRTLAKILSMLI